MTATKEGLAVTNIDQFNQITGQVLAELYEVFPRKVTRMSIFGERLAEERKRLGFNQEIMAAHGGVKKQAQSLCESGKRKPDSEYLEAISKIGVDITYVITGVSSQPALPPELAADEQMLVDAYRSLPMAQRKAMLAEALTGNKATSGKVSVKGNSNRVAGRDNNA